MLQKYLRIQFGVKAVAKMKFLPRAYIGKIHMKVVRVKDLGEVHIRSYYSFL